MVRSWLCLHVEAAIIAEGLSSPSPCEAGDCSPTGFPSPGRCREAMRGCQRSKQRGPGGPGLCHLGAPPLSCQGDAEARPELQQEQLFCRDAAQPCSAAHSHTPASPTEHSLCSVHGFCRHTTHFRLSRCPSVPEDGNAPAASCWEEGGGAAGLFAESCGTVRRSAPLSMPGLCRGKDRGAGTAWPCFPYRVSAESVLPSIPLFSCLGSCRGRAAVSGEVSLPHTTAGQPQLCAPTAALSSNPQVPSFLLPSLSPHCPTYQSLKPYPDLSGVCSTSQEKAG